MNRATCETLVKNLAAWEDWPLLSQSAIDLCLDMAKRPDSSKRPPSSPTWVETYDDNYAVGLACAMKAAKSAGRYRVTTGNTTQSREQVHEHWVAQAAYYRKKITGTLAGYGIALTTQGEYIAGFFVPIVSASDV